jgi:hypothetical protein
MITTNRILNILLILSVAWLLGSLTSNPFSGRVVMAFITTFIAPISLMWAVFQTCGSTKRG